jgi:hypothetical protein
MSLGALGVMTTIHAKRISDRFDHEVGRIEALPSDRRERLMRYIAEHRSHLHLAWLFSAVLAATTAGPVAVMLRLFPVGGSGAQETTSLQILAALGAFAAGLALPSLLRVWSYVRSLETFHEQITVLLRQEEARRRALSELRAERAEAMKLTGNVAAAVPPQSLR